MALDINGTVAGAAAGSSFGPWGTAIGGGLGALGLFDGGPSAPSVTPPERIKEYSTPFNTATSEGVSAYQDPNQANVDTARQGVTNTLAGGLGAGDARLQQFQDAYQAERSPELERNLAQQQQALNIQSATRGTAGGSSDLYKEALMNQFANEQRSQLLNQAIQGREGLANQALNQDIARLGAYTGIEQQGFGNQLQAAQLGANSYAQAQGTENAFANAASGVSANNAALQNQALANKIGMAQVVGNVGKNWNAFSGDETGGGDGSVQSDYTGDAFSSWTRRNP